MTNLTATNTKKWTVAEAKAKLSEVLRLVKEEGPQYIGAKKSFVVVSADEWENLKNTKQPLSHWLLDNMPRSGELELPERAEPEREIPFQ